MEIRDPTPALDAEPGRVEPPEEGSVCAVLSGGNVDVSLLSEVVPGPPERDHLEHPAQ